MFYQQRIISVRSQTEALKPCQMLLRAAMWPSSLYVKLKRNDVVFGTRTVLNTCSTVEKSTWKLWQDLELTVAAEKFNYWTDPIWLSIQEIFNMMSFNIRMSCNVQTVLFTQLEWKHCQSHLQTYQYFHIY